jgi:serine/threonine protein kinase
VKTFNKLKLTNNNLKKSVQNEIEILSYLNTIGQTAGSNGIVGYVNHYENRRNIHLILEHAGSIDLKSWIDSKKSKVKQGGRHLKMEKGGVLASVFL